MSELPLEIRLSSRYGRYSIDWFYLLNQNLDFYQHMSRGLLVFSDLRWEVIVRVTGIAGMVDKLWWELTNQNIFPIKIICKQKHINLKNGDWEIQSCVVERNKIFPNSDPVNGL
jgi:hypothetical protein